MVYRGFNRRFASSDAYWEQRLHRQKTEEKKSKCVHLKEKIYTVSKLVYFLRIHFQ